MALKSAAADARGSAESCQMPIDEETIAKHNKSPLALDNISNSTIQNRPVVLDKTLKARK